MAGGVVGHSLAARSLAEKPEHGLVLGGQGRPPTGMESPAGRPATGGRDGRRGRLPPASGGRPARWHRRSMGSTPRPGSGVALSCFKADYQVVP